MNAAELRARGVQLLVQLYGAGATFRDGQWEAIEDLLLGCRRVLVVQRTGWGKSLVYFVATRLLREMGAGPTILISPLLSLMRNQVDAANQLGVRAERIDSSNPKGWSKVEERLAADEVDLLMVSPERLANEQFLTSTVPAIVKRIGLFVIDEAHCISDWGHDFRPDYRRIAGFVQGLPATVPLLATTATANERVIGDVCEQIGVDVAVVRGPLARGSLRLQNIVMESQAERLAWLAEVVPTLPGHGIIYCSTTRDCDRVSGWLALHGIDAPAYHSAVESREELEQRLLNNEVKALVATVALGMGFDKPDLSFVIHFQKPGTVVDYYQRIGRAGRALDDATVVLLGGSEDDEISEYFIQAAFPSVHDTEQVVSALAANEGLTRSELDGLVNFRHSRLAQILKILEVEGAVYRATEEQQQKYHLSAVEWVRDQARIDRVTQARRDEHRRMQVFLRTQRCLMRFLTEALDDSGAADCGRCANCTAPFVPSAASQSQLMQAAADYLRHAFLKVEPRKQLPEGGKIPKSERAEYGRALCYYGDQELGSLVRRGKYEVERFDDQLVAAAVELVQDHWKPEPAPTWVAAVPSTRRTALVPDFARRVADRLGLPFRAALGKVGETPEQKTMDNSSFQFRNVESAFSVDASEVEDGPVLLIDDMVDSRWTLTVCARLLRRAGAAAVYPLVLANSSSGDAE